MNRDEAIRRIDALVQAHQELLEDLARVRKGVQDEDYDVPGGRHELAMEATVHVRKLQRLIKQFAKVADE